MSATEHFAAPHVHDDDGHVVDLITPVTLVGYYLATDNLNEI